MSEYPNGLNFTIQDINARSWAPPVNDPTLPKYRLVGRDTADMFKNKNILDSSNLVAATYIGGLPAPKPINVNSPANGDALIYNGSEWQNTPIPSGGGGFNVGNTLFVDDVYGDNATAQAFNPAKPYKTCGAAVNAAVLIAGNVLIYVRAGNYTEANLARPNVTIYWYFDLGTMVTASGILFDCNDLQTYNTNIWGRARFMGAANYLFRLAQTGAKNLYVECVSMNNAGSCLYVDGAQASAVVRVIETATCSRSIALGFADAELVDPRNAVVFLGDGVPNDRTSISIQYISNTGGGTCVLANTNNAVTWYLSCNVMTSTGPTICMQIGTSGSVEIECNGITGAAVAFTPAASNANIGAVCVKGATLTVVTENITSNGANTLYAVPAANVSGGVLNLTSLKCNTAGHPAGTTSSCINITGGIGNLVISELICTSTNAVRQTSGQMTLACNKITNQSAALGSSLISIIGGTADISASISVNVATNANCIDGSGTIRCNFYNATMIGTGSFFGSTGAATGSISLNVTNCSLASGNFIDISGSTTNAITVDVNADRITAVSGALFSINRSANGSTTISSNVKSFVSSGNLLNFRSSGTITANLEVESAQCAAVNATVNVASTIVCKVNQFVSTATNAMSITGTASVSFTTNIGTLTHSGTRIFNITNNNAGSAIFIQCGTVQSNGALANISCASCVMDIISVTTASGVTQSAGTLRTIFGFMTSSNIITLTGGTANVTGVQLVTSGLAISQTAGILLSQIANLTSAAGCLSVTGPSVCTTVTRGGRFTSGDAPCYLISNTNALSDISLQMSTLVSGRTDIGTTKAIVEISGNATISQQTDVITGAATGAHAILVSGAPTYRFDVAQIIVTGRVLTKSATTTITGVLGQVIIRSAAAVTEASILFALSGSNRTILDITEVQHLLPLTVNPVTMVSVTGGTVRFNVTSILATTHSNFTILNNSATCDIDISEADITGPACINTGTVRYNVSDRITTGTGINVFQNSNTAKFIVGEIVGASNVVTQTAGTTLARFNAVSSVTSYVFNITGGGLFTGNCAQASAVGFASISGLGDETIVNIANEYFSSDSNIPAINIEAGNVNIVMGNIIGKFEDTIIFIRSLAPVCAQVNEMQVIGAGAVAYVRQESPTIYPVKIGGNCIRTAAGPLLRTETFQGNRVYVDVTTFITDGPQVLNILGGDLRLNIQNMETRYADSAVTPIVQALTNGDFGDMNMTLTCNQITHTGDSRSVMGILMGSRDFRNCYGSIQVQSMNVPGEITGSVTDQGGILTVYSDLTRGRLTASFGLAQTESIYAIYADARDTNVLDGLLLTGNIINKNSSIRTVPVFIDNRGSFFGPSLKDMLLVSDGNFSIQAALASQNIRIYGSVTATLPTDNIVDIIGGVFNNNTNVV